MDDKCITFFEWSTPLETDDGALTFLGSTENGYFDTPLYATQEDAESNQQDVIGRLQGEFFISDSGMATGQWTYHMFETDSWIVATSGFNNNNPDEELPMAVTGGSGDYENIMGKSYNKVVNTDPFIIQHFVCEEEVDGMSSTGICGEDDCVTAYEVSDCFIA